MMIMMMMMMMMMIVILAMMAMTPSAFIIELKMFLAEMLASHPLFDIGHQWNFAWFGSFLLSP